jgi:hypothetical protein
MVFVISEEFILLGVKCCIFVYFLHRGIVFDSVLASWVTSSVAGKDLHEVDLTLRRYFVWYFRGDGEIWRVLTPVLGDLWLASKSSSPCITRWRFRMTVRSVFMLVLVIGRLKLGEV